MAAGTRMTIASTGKMNSAIGTTILTDVLPPASTSAAFLRCRSVSACAARTCMIGTPCVWAARTWATSVVSSDTLLRRSNLLGKKAADCSPASGKPQITLQVAGVCKSWCESLEQLFYEPAQILENGAQQTFDCHREDAAPVVILDTHRRLETQRVSQS